MKAKWHLEYKKSVIHIISSANKCKSHRQLFKDYRTLTVPALYVLEMLCYIKSY